MENGVFYRQKLQLIYVMVHSIFYWFLSFMDAALALYYWYPKRL